MPPRPKQKRTPAQTALRLGVAAERVVALRRERDRLVRQIGSKQGQVEKVVESARDAASVLFEKVPALLERRRALTAEIRAIFAELLARGRLSRNAQRAVLDVLESLRESGMLDDEHPFADDRQNSGAEPDAGFEDPFEGEDAPHADSGSRRSPGPEREGERGGASAAHVGGQADRGVVRELFRRLAIALHPDLTQHEAERQRRTEIMKEVTRAYEEGDLARLLGLEATWLAGASVAAEGQDTERQITSLERVVMDLKRQLKELTRKLRELKRTSPFDGLEHFAAGASERSPVEAVLHEAEQELETLCAVREYVRKFRDREISLAEFLRGPDVLREAAYGDAEFADEVELFERILAEELDFEFGRAPQRKKRSRKRK